MENTREELLSDAELLAAAKSGDEEAMDAILTKYKGLVRKLSRARFLIGGDRDDLIQEGMIGLLKAVRDYDPEGGAQFSTFAALCIERQMLHAIEASLREKNRPLNDSVALTEEEWEMAVPAESRDPASIVVDRAAHRERVEELMKKLSPLEAEVLRQYLDGRSLREIAAATGRSFKTVDNAFQRVRRKSAVRTS